MVQKHSLTEQWLLYVWRLNSSHIDLMPLCYLITVLIHPRCCFQGNCCGYRDVLEAYKQIIPDIEFSGPTNFAPLIHRAIDIVHSTRKVGILASRTLSREKQLFEITRITANCHYFLSGATAVDRWWNLSIWKCFHVKVVSLKIRSFTRGLEKIVI